MSRKFSVGYGGMTISEYQKWCVRIWAGEERELTLHDDFVMCTGLPGEVGEVLELLKKAVRDKKNILLVNRKELIKEMGDVLYYLMVVAHRQGIDPQEIIAANVKKLEKRYTKRK